MPEVLVGGISKGVVDSRTVTVDEGDITGSSDTANVGAVLPSGAIVVGREVLVNEDAVGLSDVTLTLGGTDTDGIIASTDLDALSVGDRVCRTDGALPTGNYGGQQLVATFASAGGTLADLTAGNWTITVWFIVP